MDDFRLKVFIAAAIEQVFRGAQDHGYLVIGDLLNILVGILLTAAYYLVGNTQQDDTDQ